MEENRNHDFNERKEGNISISKPLFAVIIIFLCGTLCYASYITGYMKGKEEGAAQAPKSFSTGQAAPGEDQGTAPAPAPEQAPGSGQAPAQGNGEGGGLDDIFRHELPFFGNGNEGNPGEDKGSADSGSGSGEVTEQKAYLGIMGMTVTKEMQDNYNIPAGVLIKEISKDGAAYRSEIKEGSIITSCDGQNVDSIEGLKEILSRRNPGDTVEVKLFEPVEKGSYSEKTVQVTLMGE